MMVGALAFGCAPASVDAARTLDTGRRDLFPKPLARPWPAPSRHDVVRDADDVDLARTAAAGWYDSIYGACVNPAAVRPHRDSAATGCDRHRDELDRYRRRLPSEHQTAPFAVGGGDGSGSTAQALHVPIVTRGVNSPSRAARAARLFARMWGPREGATAAFWPCSVRLVTFLLCHRRGCFVYGR